MKSSAPTSIVFCLSAEAYEQHVSKPYIPGGYKIKEEMEDRPY